MTAAPTSAVPERLPMRPGRPPALPERASASTPTAPIAAATDHHDQTTRTSPSSRRGPRALPARRSRSPASGRTRPRRPCRPRRRPRRRGRRTRATSTSAHAVPTVSRAASHTLPTVGARPLRPSVTTAGAQHRDGRLVADRVGGDGPRRARPGRGPLERGRRAPGDDHVPPVDVRVEPPGSSRSSSRRRPPVRHGVAPAGDLARRQHDRLPAPDGGPSDGGLPAWASSGPSGAAASGSQRRRPSPRPRPARRLARPSRP